MPADSKDTDVRVYQLKVTLRGLKPPVWRRCQVLSNATLAQLHLILQVVMGWDNDHLHQFLKDEKHGGPEDDAIDLEDTDAEEKTLLSDVISRPRAKLIYEYDFGDGWEHEVVIEKVLPPEKDAQYPVCLEGERACPPEDCGGVWGYENLFEIIKNPRHEEHRERLEWLGPKFDPEAFDVARTNKELKGIKA